MSRSVRPSEQKFDIDAFREAIERNAFKFVGTTLTLLWLFRHLWHELGF